MRAPAPSWLVPAAAVAVGAAAAATWTALATAAAGAFAPIAAGLAGMAFGALVAWLAARGRRHAAPTVAGGDASGRWADVACLVVLALAALRLRPAVPWPAALDGGWYAAAAVRIAADRRLSFDAPAAAVPGLVTTLDALRPVGIGAPPDARRGFYAVALAVPRVGEPRVAPYHPPFFTAAAALGVSRRGPYGAAWAAVGWALIWLLAIGALARRAGLTAGAPLAMALAALSPLFRVYGATPYAELCAGAAGLAAVLALPRARGRPARRTWLVALASGAAAGTAVVAKIDLLPFAAFVPLAWWAAAGRGAAAWSLAGALPPAAAFAALALGPTSVYAALNGAGVAGLAAARAGWLLAGAVAAAALAAAAVAGRGPRRARPAMRAPGSPGAWAGLVLVVAAAWSWRADPAAPLGMLRLLGWSATPLALFAAGLSVVRLVDAPRRAPPAAWPLVAATAFVVVAPIVTRDLSPLYAARRLAPIALPAVCLLAAACAEHVVVRTAGVRRAGLALLVAVGLLAAAAASTRLRPAREFAAVELLLDRIAGHTAPGDLVLFPDAYDGDLAARLAAPLWALHRLDVGVLAPGVDRRAPDGRAPAAAIVAAWQARPGDGRVLWAASPGTAPPAGVRVDALATETLVSEAWIPGAMPPDLSPVEISIELGVLGAADANSR